MKGETPDTRTRIVVADADRACGAALARLLEFEGYAPVPVSDGSSALKWVRDGSIPLVICEVRMPSLSGLHLLDTIRRLGLPTAVLFVTGCPSVDVAVRAMTLGANGYLVKPVDPPRLLVSVRQLVGAPADGDAGGVEAPLGRMVGASPEMKRVFRLVRSIAPSSLNIFIRGETGTGKELVARAIHDLSHRRLERFVALNSAAGPPTLAESDLFGNEEGAFTGAVRRPGQLELAHRGTLFLDEVGDMPSATQPKLLRALEGHGYRRLGGTEPVKVDVRVIAATNHDVDDLLADGRLRGDLYFRLNSVTIDLPPLRLRTGDTALLVREFVREFVRRHGKPLPDMSPQAMELLLQHPWPGNVRELRHAIEYAVIFARAGEIRPRDLPQHIREGRGPVPDGLDLGELERHLIQEAVRRFPTRVEAADALGISPGRLSLKLRQYSRLPGAAPWSARRSVVTAREDLRPVDDRDLETPPLDARIGARRANQATGEAGRRDRGPAGIHSALRGPRVSRRPGQPGAGGGSQRADEEDDTTDPPARSASDAACPPALLPVPRSTRHPGASFLHGAAGIMARTSARPSSA